MSNLSLPWLDRTMARLPATLPPALLLSGQKGLGKGALALALAQWRLCEAPTRPGYACGDCASCRLFTAGNHPDFRQLTPEVQSDQAEEGAEAQVRVPGKKPSLYIRIEAVRDVGELASMTAHRGVARVVVISPAESLYANAANALLKILEEPPPGMHFLLVSHEPHRLPKTILSRCFRVAVGIPSAEAAREWLKEKAGDRGVLALAMGAYAPLAAERLAQDEDYWGRRQALFEAFWREDRDPLALAQLAEPLEPRTLADMLQMWCHDLLACRHGLPLRYHRDFQESLRAQSFRWTPQAVAKWHDEVVRFSRSANHPLNRRLALEALFAALPS